MRKITIAALAAAAVAGTGIAATFAAVQPADGTKYTAMKAFDIDTSSKKTIGTYVKAGDKCALNLAIADTANPETATAAQGSMLSFTLPAGASARMRDAAGGAFTVTCAADAASVIVKVGNGAI